MPNNDPELLELTADVLALADDGPVTEAVDLNTASPTAGVLPAPGAAFAYAAPKAALVRLTGHQTPAALRRIGASRLAT
ncbi:hypothetical protein [Streptomyces virginiae]|uniref:Uncharacterized protein n=1 Tax=Streptomyces virginiae TaxID=1961 RepID=A0ABZ1T525_STRVG|nr:hypothetical protein [Streptomyces virginiae]WTB21048.1 hypothetical protein OG253_05845 [Streptomyces virginiae]